MRRASRAAARWADGGAAGAGAGAPAAQAARPVRGAQAKTEENVVDAEFEEVRDKGRRAS